MPANSASATSPPPATVEPAPRRIAWPTDHRDSRVWQVAALGLLLTYGMTRLGFDQVPANVAILIATALATQWLGQRYAHFSTAPGRLKMLQTPELPARTAFDPLSPLITALSLSLLLRATSPGWLVLAAVLAIGQKFLLRIDGKHVFNPANFAICMLLLCSECAWISPSQWGSATWAAFLFASLAILVLSRARRADIALAFLATYVAILFARALYLGDPWSIPFKQMQSGAILLFAFFMITDPKTTPDRRAARIVYAVGVAMLGAWLQYWHYIPTGMMYALFFASPFVPLIDRLVPRRRADVRFQWSRPVVN